jgi:hypothetical protein
MPVGRVGGTMQPESESVVTTSNEEAVAELAPRLLSVEGLPLEQRAAAFAVLHDELRAALEGADVPGDLLVRP